MIASRVRQADIRWPPIHAGRITESYTNGGRASRRVRSPQSIDVHGVGGAVLRENGAPPRFWTGDGARAAGVDTRNIERSIRGRLIHTSQTNPQFVVRMKWHL